MKLSKIELDASRVKVGDCIEVLNGIESVRTIKTSFDGSETSYVFSFADAPDVIYEEHESVTVYRGE